MQLNDKLRDAIEKYQSGNYAESERISKEILQNDSHNARALNLLGMSLHERGLSDAGIVFIKKATEADPQYHAAHNNLGAIYRETKRFELALLCIDRAIALNPASSDYHLNRALVLAEMGDYENSLAGFKKTILLDPELLEAYIGRGAALYNLNRFAEALPNYDKAIELHPTSAEGWEGRGNILTELKQYDNAFAAFDRALTLKPNLAEAWVGRGNLFMELKQYDKAYAALDKALKIKPDLKYIEGSRLHAKLMICNWSDLEADVSHLLSAIKDHRPTSVPFTLLSISSSPADQLNCARCYIGNQPVFQKIWRGEMYSHERIRVAYLSADLHEHATANLMAGLFEQHDKSRFELTAISFGPDEDSDIRRRIKDAFENFIDARFQRDQQIADIIRHLEIDIAVDLKGFTRNERLNIFARRPAPIQVNYLGYPGTMGADYFDYILADRTVIPKSEFDCYTEKVVWLPDSYQVNDSQRRISTRTPTRSECALPEAAFVFCCFNNTFKITPSIFDIWMRLLQATEDGVLWLLDGNPTASTNLRREAEKRGVSSERLIFAPKITIADHLARHRQADLFLDTLHCNAHTTASDALWAGLPVLTCLGSTFAARVAGSLLSAVGLTELITTSLEGYEVLALKLARDRSLLASLKNKLAHNRDTYPLFNTKRFTRHIEAAYTTMWQRHQMRETPQCFEVDPIN